jgi:hypothetical protein
MSLYEKNRLKQKLQYFKGYNAALLWMQENEPDYDTIEESCEFIKNKIEDFQLKIKKHDSRSKENSTD